VPTAYPADSRKFFAKCAIIQSERNIVSLRGITGNKGTQIRKKKFLYAHEVTQRFKLQRPGLESCRAEGMLRLFIAEHCYTV